jgi:hypothetical protein
MSCERQFHKKVKVSVLSVDTKNTGYVCAAQDFGRKAQTDAR